MSKRLIATIGLPGSGKSTWAVMEKARLEEQGLKIRITNKDEIRSALSATGWTWSPENEKDVLKFQNSEIKSAFAHGADVVIVADTNFGKHRDRLKGLAFHCNAAFEVKDFTKVPLATCIQQDAMRPEGLRVGPDVITDMYNKHLTTEIVPYVPNKEKPSAIICDLDGTLALHNNKRSPYDISKVGDDDLNGPIADILRTYATTTDYTIIYVSGREDSCREATEDWLFRMHVPTVAPHILYMRQTKDHRKDDIVKLEIFNRYIRNNYWVRFCLDDRDRVVKMWRELGLACLQVNYGNF